MCTFATINKLAVAQFAIFVIILDVDSMIGCSRGVLGFVVAHGIKGFGVATCCHPLAILQREFKLLRHTKKFGAFGRAILVETGVAVQMPLIDIDDNLGRHHPLNLVLRYFGLRSGFIFFVARTSKHASCQHCCRCQ